jgi:hypothetical protein
MACPQYVPAIISAAPRDAHTVSRSPPRPIPMATAQIGSVPSSRLARLAEVCCTARVWARNANTLQNRAR